MTDQAKIQQILESLSPLERNVIPFINEGTAKEIEKKSGQELVSVVRALGYLESKKLIQTETTKLKIINLDANGILYRKNGLPERKLLELLTKKKSINLQDAQKESDLNENEFKVSLGVLKSKALIDLKEGRVILTAKENELSKQFIEEKFLESVPRPFDNLEPEEQFALKNLEKRKNILRAEEEKTIKIKVTELGKEIFSNINQVKELIEELTPQMIKIESWKGKKFRRYDIHSPVPKLTGGKKHFVNQSIEYAREIWKEMGFEEMSGNITVSSFWNFDALFTAQDHPVREMQDTFFIKDLKAKLPEKKLVESVRKAHEGKIEGSKGWQYVWDEEKAKKVLVRTHTTCLSAQTLAKVNPKELPKKFFAVGKCFRNETVDWSHGFEFNQTEGIVIDKNANFRHLLGYLKEFFRKMGYPEVKFVPSYFPYTEPSVEIYAFNSMRKVWIEIGGAGIFRPEVSIALLGENIPILAWGPGFDRVLMEYYKINDLRDLYKNDLAQIRKMKMWIK